MKLVFLGTRGGIKLTSLHHKKHSSLLISSGNTKIIIDYGLDWERQYNNNLPDALFITHAHPDHAGALEAGIRCPVYATQETWERVNATFIQERIVIFDQKTIAMGTLNITPYAVYHSLHAPAVGYKISSADKAIFYVPDVAEIKDPSKALNNIQLYIGDGAIITRTMLLRKKKGVVTGHAPIEMQLLWCKHHKVPATIFTHCGSEIVRKSLSTLKNKILELEKKYDVPITIAYDGMQLNL